MKQLLIHNALLFDCTGRAPQSGGAMLVEDGQIKAVGTNQSLGADTLKNRDDVTAIDAGGRSLLPGLIDGHVHLSQVFVTESGAHRVARLEPDSWFALRMLRNAWDALCAGITTVRVVGDHNHIDLELKRAIHGGQIPGPRIVTAGRPIISTGGHGHNLVSCLEADGPYEIRKAARAQIKAGADLVKLMITGGIASPGEQVDTPQMTFDEMEAATTVAHHYDKPVAAHAGGIRSIQMAIKAGVDCFEHGYIIDEETADMLVRENRILVPTLGVTHHPEYIEDSKRPEWWRLKAQRAKQRHQQSFLTCLRAGVKIGIGSDIPDIHEYGIKEMELLQSVGMDGMKVLEAATRVNAEICRVADRVGTLETGKDADCILVDGDPRTVTNVRKLRLVVKSGKIIVSKLASVEAPAALANV